MAAIGRRNSLLRFLTAAAAGIGLFALLGARLLPVAKAFAAASITAFLIKPMEGFFEKRMPRGLAVACSFLVLILLLASLASLIAVPVSSEIVHLAEYARKGADTLSEALYALTGTRADFLKNIPSDAFSDAQGALRGVLSSAGSAASFITGVMVVIALSWFLLLDWDTFSLRMLMLVPQGLRKKTLCALSGIRRDLGGYLRAQGMLMAIVGAMTVAVLTVIGTPMPVAMGAMYALLNAIPYFGPLIGIIPPVLSALAVGGMRALYTFLALIVIQQVDNYVLSPRIMGAASGAGAATVLFAITAGNQLFGVAGMFLAVPLLISAKAVYRAFIAPST